MGRVIFMGKTGCGKTTLCQALNNLEIKYKKTQAIELYDNAIDTPVNTESYVDEYQTKLIQLIETKIAGKEVVSPVEEKQEPGKVIDLMEALKASVKKAKKEKDSAW